MVEDQSNFYQSRAKWTANSTKIFANLLVEQIQQGNRPNNVFNKKAWKHIREEFNKQTGLKFDRQQLKNHLDVLRKRYNYVKVLLDQNEFSWDVSQCMVIAEDAVWKKYIEAHPEAEAIRKKGCPIYEQLCTIFSDSEADGKCALSNSGEMMHQMDEDQSRAKWSTSLEKIFVELMLEQVLQGNRSNNSFSKKAWNYICDEFNRQTGLNFHKQQLKNRHGVLRRLYNSLKLLLDQDGFSWDESRGLAIAEDEVWAKYIEEHPEVESIRFKGCLVYEQLHGIFSDLESDGKSAFAATTQMDDLPSQDQSKLDQSRAKWMPSLDKIFVDLLVRKNQQNCVSNKKAWKGIREEFNKQTGLNFEEQQLRNHQSVLRRWYNNINSLLYQAGFSWDESKHMVMADGKTWENHIKAYPECETIRNKECPIFKQLCILFSGSEAEGRYVQSGHDFELDHEIVTANAPEAASMSAEPVADEASSQPGDDMNIPDGWNKRRITTLNQCFQRRTHTEASHNVEDAVLETACRRKKRASMLSQRSDQFSISSCIKVLNEMEGVEEDLYLAALDLFQDPDRRETFISIRSDIRMPWLKGKCSSMS